ncbi:MAG: hypothetical protein Q4B88_03435 [Moraxella sp.]|nr:hypothetical protein [Moraxella sp.]
MSTPFIHHFGDPEPVLDGRTVFEYGFCPKIGEYYEYPFDIYGVAKLFRAASHHTSALMTKKMSL